jgi:hypothetical protein
MEKKMIQSKAVKPNTWFRYWDVAEAQWYTGWPLLKSILLGAVLAILFNVVFFAPFINSLIK